MYDNTLSLSLLICQQKIISLYVINVNMFLNKLAFIRKIYCIECLLK